MKFEKVSYEEAVDATFKAVGWVGDSLKDDLDKLPLPTRSTAQSAGYDFYCPYDVVVRKGKTTKIPLLVKVVNMPNNVALFILNRSGLSLNKGLRIENAVGLIDADYSQTIWYQAKAETQDVIIKQGDRICQGVFIPFLTVSNERKPKTTRKGGLGSTGK